MDVAALSTSVSSLNIPPVQSSTPRELYHFKILNPSLHNLSSAKKPNSISSNCNRPTLLLSRNNSIPAPFIPTSHSPTTLHRNAATGYAAALIDAALLKNSLGSVERDVKRLLKLMKERDIVVKEEVKGGFERHLVALVKMLVQKNKLGMVKEVMDEFQRIYEGLLVFDS